jgi:hypothetical protein
VLGGDVSYARRQDGSIGPPPSAVNFDDEAARSSAERISAEVRAGVDIVLTHDVARWRDIDHVTTIHEE